jgi:putative membrane protein
MKIFFSVLLNISILYLLTFLLTWNIDSWLSDWIKVIGWWKTYVMAWIILGLLNITVKPVLKILSLPFSLFFLGFTVFLVNAAILFLLDYIINIIIAFPWISYSIDWPINFIISVAIFTFLNIIYSLLFNN